MGGSLGGWLVPPTLPPPCILFSAGRSTQTPKRHNSLSSTRRTVPRPPPYLCPCIIHPSIHASILPPSLSSISCAHSPPPPPPSLLFAFLPSSLPLLASFPHGGALPSCPLTPLLPLLVPSYWILLLLTLCPSSSSPVVSSGGRASG